MWISPQNARDILQALGENVEKMPAGLAVSIDREAGKA